MTMPTLQRRNKYGFTLIELLVVIGIIGLLSVLSVIALGSAREKARDAKRVADLEKMQSALELYFIAHNEYPLAGDAVPLGAGTASCFGVDGFGAIGCAGSYLERVPVDPSSGSYIYTSADGVSYQIQADLEGDVDGLRAHVVATPSGISNAGN
ncbi:MAG: hypothetical protein COU35_00100 [Candidatus Magasanikbacteria bacterium CG10_big_fil_rev_8_21_14_0_10_47_10]|uniref:Type II secretion system protein GspG C-terminal domain-containing protein n=1 Tax=Candidatus Magasanikbacteria bacterium CG10_big_fil_rev_8_21_14_0_10_47_10 TaxID=1974652 RepID=A0A2H0TRS3_9BACT|nr:MAG: hypothetical protein COU35_00100 [Candidatus Magasanikbacteria bacterium CG10_big_fil_rev_8_21_14_0_10_47_10]